MCICCKLLCNIYNQFTRYIYLCYEDEKTKQNWFWLVLFPNVMRLIKRILCFPCKGIYRWQNGENNLPKYFCHSLSKWQRNTFGGSVIKEKKVKKPNNKKWSLENKSEKRKNKKEDTHLRSEKGKGVNDKETEKRLHTVWLERSKLS